MAMSLLLPRDELTVPVARHLTAGAMEQLGVDSGCASDIEVALTEACTNVILHSGPGDQYEVAIELDDEVCVIRIIDRGVGFDPEALADSDDHSAESGRGMTLMHALVDQVVLQSRPEDGTIVHLEKTLEYQADSVMRRLTDEDD
jgi:serine/threonine-protein kinase RsbW